MFWRWQVMLVVALGIILLTVGMPAIQRYRAFRYLETHGCQYELTETNAWLTEWFGDSAKGFREVDVIAMDPDSVTDETLLQLSEFKEVRFLIWRQVGNPISITRRGVEALQQLDQLETLLLKGPGFSDNLMSEWLSVHPPLQRVDLTLTEVSQKTLQQLTEIPTLSRLCITHCVLTDDLFDGLPPAPALTELLVPGTKVGDHFAEWASQSPSLTSLSMAATLVSNEGLADLGRLQHLDVLNVAACPNITPEGMGHLECLSVLTHLGISSSEVTPASIESFQNLPRLREIAVMGSIADSSLRETLRHHWELIER